MASRHVRIAGLEWDLTDVVTLGGLIAFTAAVPIVSLFGGRLRNPGPTTLVAAAFIGFYILAVSALRRPLRPWVRFVVRTASVQLAFVQVFQLANELETAFFPWQDDRVLALEKAVFGLQPLVAIQKLYSVPLNEWMFFVYVFYLIIYPSLGAVIYFKHGEAANEDYLYLLGLVNLICGLGFVVFPVASPMNWPSIRAVLTEPLKAGIFGSIAEFIRHHIHRPGGSVPSPHCAVATVMWFMSRRYTRHGFLVLSPVILSLYVSTVYGRFHYVTDVVAGIAVALLVLFLIGPLLKRAWNGGPETPEGGPL
jgi:membrane-associated phospholipid phosphatase